MSNVLRDFKKDGSLSLVISIPIMIISDMIDRECFCFRDSLSDYVNATNNHPFISMLSISSMFYILCGVTDKTKKHYIYMGVCLYLTSYFNHSTNPVEHYIFAGTFFTLLIFDGIKLGLKNNNIILVILLIIGFVSLFSRIYYLPLFLWSEIYCVILAVKLLKSGLISKDK